MNGADAHLLISNFPAVLNLTGICLLVAALSSRNRAISRTALVVLLCAAILVVPAYISGGRAEKMVRTMEGLNVVAIEPHREVAMGALVFVVLQGIVALAGLLTAHRRGLVIGMLVLSILSTLFLFYAVRLGERIHHPEMQMRHG